MRTDAEGEFTFLAIPYTVGESKRFFRDTTWAVHVPRRQQEARVQLARATDELQCLLGRTPTVKDLSELMSLPEEEVREARPAANGYNSTSLDAATGGGEDGESALQGFIGAQDQALEPVEALHTLAQMHVSGHRQDRCHEASGRRAPADENVGPNVDDSG